jgi:hypothetical protein
MGNGWRVESSGLLSALSSTETELNDGMMLVPCRPLLSESGVECSFESLESTLEIDMGHGITGVLLLVDGHADLSPHTSLYGMKAELTRVVSVARPCLRLCPASSLTRLPTSPDAQTRMETHPGRSSHNRPTHISLLDI